MTNSIQVVPAEKCYGCTACLNICPKKAISWTSDEEGFYIPCIDLNKCVDCGKCQKVCPALNLEAFETLDRSDSYGVAVQSSNKQDLNKSSSGGMFSLIAAKIIEEGGVVCGCAWNEMGIAKHIIVEKKEELDQLRRSKYVQSNLNTVYSEVKECIDNGKKVVFCGTPCQIAGLHLFLSGINTENIITISLVCHGVPSPLLLSEYIKWLEEQSGKKITEIRFRDKDKYGWGHNIALYFSDNSKKQMPSAFDNYYSCYIEGVLNRKVCYSCPFRSLKYGNDLLIGDYWKAKQISKPMDIGSGLSAVAPMTKKGMELLRSLSDGRLIYQTGCMKLEDLLLQGDSQEEAEAKYAERQKMYKCFLSDRISFFKEMLKANPSFYDWIKRMLPSGIRIWLKKTMRAMLKKDK